MPEKNYYEILDIEAGADTDTIKTAYRKLMRQYHPDKFVADLARLQKVADKQSFTALERKMQDAKIQAKRINEAYSVLADTTKRQAYDRKLSEDRMAVYHAELQRERSREPDVHRRTVKTRRHRRPGAPPPKPGALPWIMFGGLVLVSIIVFSLFTGALTRSFAPSYTHVPRASTAEGIITAHELQATQDVINATNVVRTQTANDPTITPLSPEQYARSADRLLERGLVSQALDMYTRAIQYAPHDAELFYKRGLVYLIRFGEGDEEAGQAALLDFNQALALEPTFATAYRELGTLYFSLWQAYNEADAHQLALKNLEHYRALVNDATVDAMLATLRENRAD